MSFFSIRFSYTEKTLFSWRHSQQKNLSLVIDFPKTKKSLFSYKSFKKKFKQQSLSLVLDFIFLIWFNYLIYNVIINNNYILVSSFLNLLTEYLKKNAEVVLMQSNQILLEK